ncbi:MAG TPA: aspartyl/asparaginyl beta-hydroxylase domain-containing protein [Pseudoxanthomonas sp.]|nr:aspartyl/asparaginyl beta-hydroxylase domain-containing protein [Pseudoxanthomonas sp.]
MTDFHPPRIADLLAQAGALARQGRGEEAEPLWRQVLALDPRHPTALNHLGARALAQGDLAAARDYLERAVAAGPSLAIAHANLARLRSQSGDMEGALAALDSAIRADPVAWGAYFEKARLLEACGRQREAGMAWSTGLQYMPETAMQAPQLQPVLEQARQAVARMQAELAAFLEDRMRDLGAGRGRRDMERMDHALDIVSGRRSFVTARPLMLPIPRLPAIPFFHPGDYPWTAKVESAFPDILRELQALLEDASGFVPYVQTPAGQPQGQFRDLDRTLDWSAFFLWRNGSRIDANADRCPCTEAALAHAPQITVPGRAPVSFFSALRPGVHIPPHNGATNARLTVHLPLIIPPDCALRVGDETRAWEPGKLLMFDDTIRHEAWNRSDRLRVVLIFDVWHPMLTDLEREAVARIVGGMMSFYGHGADLGEL